jgi:ribonuclease J
MDRGFLEDPSIYGNVRERLTAALNEALEEGVDDTHRLQQVIRRQLGRWVSGTYRRRPMIIPVVVAI